MRIEVQGKRVTQSFETLSDLIDVADQNGHKAKSLMENMAYDPRWFGGVRSMAELVQVAREGLPADGIKAASIADHKVQSVEREHELPAFTTFYDVTGSDVDVARYLSGEPECMIAHTMMEMPRAGRIITLVVSVTVNSHISATAIRKRGNQVMALVFALEKIGLQVELWADSLADGGYGSNRKQARTRIRIKAPGEPMDAGRAMFAFTHPGMLRGLVLPAMHAMPDDFHEPMGIGHSYGATASNQDLKEYPEGSILIPPLRNDDSSETLVADTLRELGLIND